jgi:parallel beta-helix repeat protein
MRVVALSISLAFGVTGCGGSGKSSSPTQTSGATSGTATTGTNTNTTTSATSSAALPALSTPDTTQAVLTLPSNIANGSIVELQCGRTYRGTLDLKGKSNVTVRTAGTCGKAVLTPGQAITGWAQYQGNIYSAPISFTAAQLLIDGQPVSAAHWPSRAQTWATATGSSANSLSYAMPNTDLAGATLIFRPYEWALEARKITGYANGAMALTTTGNTAYDGYALSGAVDFYVEGKLWMLDEPGEWAVSNGRLYVWTPDGKSPEGRAWAAPDQNAIDASDSSNISIDGVRVYSAANGINATGATKLSVTNVDIVNSSENGIVNSGGSGLLVDRSSIRNSRHDAISVHWGGGGETISNSSIDASGVIGMPANARAAIDLTVGDGSQILNNSVTNSGYIGIRFFRNATVSKNTVDTSCVVLTDCGGLATFAPDKQPLNTRIDGNTVRNVAPSQKLAWGIYLGDYVNGTTVVNNIVAGNGNGMNIFDGFNNSISGNTFSDSTQAHIQMSESGTAASVRNNAVSGNTFIARKGEETYRISSDLGTASVAQFGTYDNNSYKSSSAVFANYNGEPLSYAQWKAKTGQDAASTLTAP